MRFGFWLQPTLGSGSRWGVAYERIGGFTVRRLSLPAGDAGTRMTLGYMRRMAIEGSKDLEVRSAAIEALDRYGAPAHAPIAALGAIYRYIQDRIRFVPDPVGAQMVQSPRATLDFRAGNCAQRATLLAAMARSVGVPADLHYRVAALNPAAPRSFSHVYVVANVLGKQIPLDPTYPDMPPGSEPQHPYRTGDFPVYQRLSGCSSPGCYSVIDPTLGWNPFKAIAGVVKKAILPAAMFATKFIPGGVVVSTAAQLALSRAGARTGVPPAIIGRAFGKLTTKLDAARAAAATPMTQVAPMVAASMVAASPTISSQATPISESQVAQAAASEAPAPVQAGMVGAGSSMVPLLVVGAILFLSRPKRGH